MAKGNSDADSYPMVGFFFTLEVAGITEQSNEVGFQDVRGLSFDIQTEEIQEGGELFSYKVPVSVKFPNLVLKRGMIKAHSALWDWCAACVEGGSFPKKIKPKLVTLKLLSPENKKIVMSWKFERAYPIKYEISGFNAQSQEILVENIELCYRSFSKS